MERKIVKRVILVALFCLPLIVSTLYARGPQPLQSDGSVDWWHLIVGLMGGLAFFLYGMEMMSRGLNKSAGNSMRSILSALTGHRFIALIVGIVVTMMIQSSSVTTVMLVGFVQAGLMTFVNSLGVLLGASIGTTITGQLVAFKITDLAYLMVAFGFGITFFGKKKEILGYVGEIFLGFGILFLGMKFMSSAMSPLRSYPEFIELLKGLENPVYGILFATIFTALIQSSSAFLGIIIALAQQDLITLDAGVPLVIGTNIGTCATALLASIGASREATRVAIAHISFKIFGAVLVVGWIPQFADLVREMSEYFGSSNARNIANAHTVYNVGLALLFFPFTPLFAKAILKVLPEKKAVGLLPVLEAKHLDDSMISSPPLAIDVARAEIGRMAMNIKSMLSASILPIVSDDKTLKDAEYEHLSLIEGIQFREKKINFLEKEVSRYLLKVCQQGLSDDQAHEAYTLISIANDLESIADIISKAIVPQITKKSAMGVNFSDEGLEELTIYHSKACKQIARLHGALAVYNPDKARHVIAKLDGYLNLESDYRILHLERVRDKRHETVATHELHTALMDCFKRINVYTGDIAKMLISLAGH